MHLPSNATDVLMHAPISLVEDKGMTASLSLVTMAAPMATSTVAAAGPATLTAMLTVMLTTLFVKLNNYCI